MTQDDLMIMVSNALISKVDKDNAIQNATVDVYWPCKHLLLQAKSWVYYVENGTWLVMK